MFGRLPSRFRFRGSYRGAQFNHILACNPRLGYVSQPVAYFIEEYVQRGSARTPNTSLLKYVQHRFIGESRPCVSVYIAETPVLAGTAGDNGTLFQPGLGFRVNKTFN